MGQFILLQAGVMLHYSMQTNLKQIIYLFFKRSMSSALPDINLLKASCHESKTK
jgi:hypothetical protein